MSVHNVVTDRIAYSRQLVQASRKGFHDAEAFVLSGETQPLLAASARAAIKSALIGAGVGWFGASLQHRHTGRLPKVIACGALAFCADFVWRTRRIGSRATDIATHELDRVRDQHWLELNPIDYA